MDILVSQDDRCDIYKSEYSYSATIDKVIEKQQLDFRQKNLYYINSSYLDIGVI